MWLCWSLWEVFSVAYSSIYPINATQLSSPTISCNTPFGPCPPIGLYHHCQDHPREANTLSLLPRVVDSVGGCVAFKETC